MKILITLLLCLLPLLGNAQQNSKPIVRCTAITKAGTQCSRKAMIQEVILGPNFCRQHASISTKVIIPDTSHIYIGKNGGKYKMKNGRKIYIVNK
jgi:hypothetical protein